MGEGLGVGVIGLGFMGRTHLSAYATAAQAGQPNRVVAVSDSNPGVADDQSLLADLQDVVMYEDAEALIADSRVDVVSICTPTDSHVPLACAALEAGKHALVEKPLALTVATGLISATLLTLVVIPVTYKVVEEWLERRRGELT